MRLELPPITMTGAPSPVHTPDPATQSELSTYWMPLAEPIYEWASFAQHAEQRVPALSQQFILQDGKRLKVRAHALLRVLFALEAAGESRLVILETHLLAKLRDKVMMLQCCNDGLVLPAASVNTCSYLVNACTIAYLTEITCQHLS